MAKRPSSAKPARPARRASRLTPGVSFALRALLAGAIAAIAWPTLSVGYVALLKGLSAVLGGVFGVTVTAGPAGASWWLVPAIAVIAAARASLGRRAAAVALTLGASLLADALLGVIAALAGLSPETTQALYAAVQAVLPFAAVLVFAGGRPASLWGGR